MAYWLVKTEPDEYRFDDLAAAGRDVWDGVRSHLAQRHLQAMRPGDHVFVYHTGKERAIAGIATVVSEPYPDPTGDDPRWQCVDLAPVRRLPRPVTLRDIKRDPRFQSWELVRNSRLSVMPVPPAIWRAVLEMAGEAAANGP